MIDEAIQQNKRIRVQYSAQFASQMKEMVEKQREVETNQMRLSENQIRLEVVLTTLVDQQKQIILLLKRFVLFGLPVAIVLAIAAIVIAVLS